jgi:hypothetical protein
MSATSAIDVGEQYDGSQHVVAFCRVGLEGEVGGILVRRVVPQRELDGTAVDAGAQAVRAGEPLEPGDAAEQLALDGGRALGIAVRLVQEDRGARFAVVGHLLSLEEHVSVGSVKWQNLSVWQRTVT